MSTWVHLSKRCAHRERPWSEDGLDEEDMQWVDKQRGGRVSDAILSCPCCMEIVTIDCQVHAQYGRDQSRGPVNAADRHYPPPSHPPH